MLIRGIICKDVLMENDSYNVFYGLGLEVCYSCNSFLVTKSALFSARRVYINL